MSRPAFRGQKLVNGYAPVLHLLLVTAALRPQTMSRRFKLNCGLNSLGRAKVVGILLNVLLMFQHANAIDDIPVFNGNCRLVYSVVSEPMSEPGKSTPGTFQVDIGQDSVLYRYSPANGDGFVAEFGDGKSCVQLEKTQVDVYEGLCLDSLPIKLYFPFNFKGMKTIRPIGNVPRLNTEAFKKQFPNALNTNNVAVVVTERQETDLSVPATLRSEGTGPNRTVSLRLSQPYRSDSVCTDMRIVGGNEVPGKIDLTGYGLVTKDGMVTGSRPEVVHHFVLKSATADLPKREWPTMLSVVKDGMLVSYLGKDKSATVLYNSKGGPFESQLDEQVAIIKDSKGKFLVTEGGSRHPFAEPEREPPVVPLFLAMGFGAITVAFILRSRNSGRARK